MIRSEYGSWYITLDDRHSLMLYHQNTVGIQEAYHVQKIHAGNVAAYMRYIVSHDRFRAENPLCSDLGQEMPEPPRKGMRNYRAKLKEYKNLCRKKDIRRVMDMIDDLS